MPSTPKHARQDTSSSDYFLVCKDIRVDVIREKHLAVSLWLEMSILIFKRLTTAIESPIVACLSPSIAVVARPMVTSFSCYDFTWHNCENPSVLLFHGWFSNSNSSDLPVLEVEDSVSDRSPLSCHWLLLVSSLLLWNCFYVLFHGKHATDICWDSKCLGFLLHFKTSRI